MSKLRVSLVYIVCLSVFVSISSCEGGKSSESLAFEVEAKPLNGKVISLDSVQFPKRVILAAERNVFFLVNMGEPGQDLISIYDLESGVFKKSFLARGNGPNELLSVGRVQVIENQMLFVTGELKKKGFVYNLDSLLLSQNDKPTSLFEFGTRSRNPLYLGENSLIDVRDNFQGADILAKVNFIDMKGEVISSHGNFPEERMDLQPFHLNEMYRFFMDVNDRQIVLAHAYTDLIEVYDLTGKKLFSNQGPDFIDPVVIPQKVGQGHMVVPTIETRMGFTFVNVGPKGFMALYSGKLMTEASEHIDRLMRFNESGQILWQYQLDMPIVHFDIDWDRKLIYGLSHELAGESSEIGVVRYEF